MATPKTLAAVAAIDAISGRTDEPQDWVPGGDPGTAHAQADKILLSLVPPEVAEAYRRLSEDRCAWWATA